MSGITRKSFSSGEIPPELYARTDYIKHSTGLRTCRNTTIKRYGGAENRAGTKWGREAGNGLKKVRVIDFAHISSKRYAVEIGENYIRFFKDNEQIRYAGRVATNITQANPAVVTTSIAHLYSNGDEVFISGILGMTEVNGKSYKVANVTANTFELTDMYGNNVDSTSYSAFTITSGSIEKVYQLETNYLEDEIFQIQYVQNDDIITLVHPNHPPSELKCNSDLDWEFYEVSFSNDIEPPTGLYTIPTTAGTVLCTYQVTSINNETYEESFPGVVTATIAVTTISKSNPAVVTTAAAHLLSDDDYVHIEITDGMVELNNVIAKITVLTPTTFELNGIDSTTYGTFVALSERLRRAFVTALSVTPTSGNSVLIAWDKIKTASEYNVYKLQDGKFGLIGITSNAYFYDIGQTPDTSDCPPYSSYPFRGEGNYPSVVGNIQQRRAYCATNLDLERVRMSHTGSNGNFSFSSPLKSDDAISFRLSGSHSNIVKGALEIGKPIIFTESAEWALGGDGSGMVKPLEVNAKQYSNNGCGNIQPLLIDDSAIYLQARNSIIRDLAYSFEADGYKGNELTEFGAHLVDGFTIVDWAYQKTPNRILWVVRNDGILLGLTYVKEHQVLAWHRHDTDGLVESVCVVPEGNIDSLYLVVKREINGVNKRYIERMEKRLITDIVDSVFTDCSVTYDGRNTNLSHTMVISGGSTWESGEVLTLTSSDPWFYSYYVGLEIHLISNLGVKIRAEITAFTSSTEVSVMCNRTIPAELRSIATSSWSLAKNYVEEIYHLEGKNVSVFADGFVVASPFNDSYDLITVTNGTAQLPEFYSVINVGLPYISDIETLDIDTSSGKSIADTAKNISHVTINVKDTRGLFIGTKPPTQGYLTNLIEPKIRNEEGYDDPVSLKTGIIETNVLGNYNSNGRVFIRQIDPVPMSILSITASGVIGVK